MLQDFLPASLLKLRAANRFFFLEAVDQDNKTVERVFMAEPSQSGVHRLLSLLRKERIEEHPNGDRYVVLNDGKTL